MHQRNTSGLWRGRAGPGRPKGRDLKALLKKKYGADAKGIVAELVRLADDDSTPKRVKVQVWGMLLDRMEGKPAQRIEIDVPTVPLFALPAGALPDIGGDKKGDT